MNPRTTVGLFLVTLGLVGFQAPATTAGVITNGTFSDPGSAADPFDGWSTDTGSGFAAPVESGGVAEFTITGFIDDPVHLFQTFSLPKNALTLSFEFRLSSVSGGLVDAFATNNSFQASLIRASDFEFQFPIDDFLPAFYAVDAGGFEGLSAGVSTADLADGWKRVTLDVTSLAAGDYIIDFLLLGDDDGLTTTVLLDNVMVTQIPEPSALAVWAMLSMAALPLRRRRTGSYPVRNMLNPRA